MELKDSAHTPDYNPADWLVLTRGDPALADVAALKLAGTPTKYWQINGGRVAEIDQSGKDALTAQEASVLKAAAEQVAQDAIASVKSLPALDPQASTEDRLRALEKMIFGA